MTDFSENIEFIEKELRETPYHKGTEHYIGKMRARLARLKDKQLEGFMKSKGGGGGGGYAVKKEGDATVVLIGSPSVGKSTLINKLTNAESKVAPYSFTTVSVIPGMLIYKEAYIQILDVPGLIEGARLGKGRGKEVLSVARGADLLVIMTDVKRKDDIKKLIFELEKSGIRINRQKPLIRIEKKIDGGLYIHSNIHQDLSEELIKDVALEFGIKNADITLKEKVSLEGLIDSFSKNRVYIPALFIINKIDEVKNLKKEEGYLYMSADKEEGLEEFKEAIYKALNLITVYLVKEDEDPNFDSPVIMKEGNTFQDLLEKLGTNFTEKYKMAKIWGRQARFPGQEIPLKTKLTDGLQARFV